MLANGIGTARSHLALFTLALSTVAAIAEQRSESDSKNRLVWFPLAFFVATLDIWFLARDDAKFDKTKEHIPFIRKSEDVTAIKSAFGSQIADSSLSTVSIFNSILFADHVKLYFSVVFFYEIARFSLIFNAILYLGMGF